MLTRSKIIILLSILVVGLAAFFAYKIYLSNFYKTSVTGDINTSTSVVDMAKKVEFEQAIEKISATDQDLDGLSDSQEVIYKTDPASADTDGDGLTDWQEVSIYTSDPLKSDTDGDTFTDGYEVRHGFSPKGTGKL